MTTPDSEGPGSRTVVDGVTVGPFQENTFFLRLQDDDRVIAIDPGDEAPRLQDIIDQRGWKPVAIVNTHGHLDHIGAVAPLQERYGIPFYLHASDIPILEQSREDAAYFGVPEPAMPRVDHRLQHDQPLELAGLSLRVLHTPGHTPGGVSLCVDGRVFSGDALFLSSIGRTDLPGGHAETLLRSIHERLLTLPDATIVHCGHGADTTIGRERSQNPFLADRDGRTL